MNLNFINIIESSVMLAILYLFYEFFLKKETFFKMNRLYLISTLLFAITIPFFSFSVNIFNYSHFNNNLIQTLTNFKQGYNELNEVIIYANKGSFSWGFIKNLLLLIYITGVFVSFTYFVFGLIKILLLIFRSNTKTMMGKYKIVETPESIFPFSLFKWIIINPEKYSSDDVKQIIEHEKIHVFQLHSIDLIFIEVLVILFWFNPFIYWYRKSIREVHEYLADQAVVENGCDRIDYQKLLLSQCAGNRYVGLTSRFSYSLSKNRLKMLTMMKSKNITKIKILLVIPAIIIAFFLFTNPIELAKANESSTNITQLVAQQDTTDEVIVEIVSAGNNGQQTDRTGDEVYTVVEDMPKFQGKSADEFRFYIQKNLKYPEEAQKNHEQGRVFVSFIVNKNGKVQDVKVERGVSESLDKEAVRVVNSSPKWEPGLQDGKRVNVQYTFPIVFKLN